MSANTKSLIEKIPDPTEIHQRLQELLAEVSMLKRLQRVAMRAKHKRDNHRLDIQKIEVPSYEERVENGDVDVL